MTEETNAEPEDGTTLVRICSPDAFFVADFLAFITKVLESSPLTDNAGAAIYDLADILMSGTDRFLMAATVEDEKFVGLVMAENNTGALTPGCFVLHFFNEGSPESRKYLVAVLRDFAREGGMSKIRGFDANFRPRAFARLFGADFAQLPARLGEMFEFDA